MGKAQDGMVAAMNSPLMKDVRQTILAGRWHSNCEMCKEREAVGVKSSRTTANWFRRDHGDAVATTRADGSLPDPKILYMDLRFSNLCNFKCRSCNFRNSSAWYEDEKALYNEITSEARVIESGIDMRELKSQLPFVKSIDFVGGEPLMDKAHREVLFWLRDHRRFDVRLNYITNLSQLKEGGVNFLELWKDFTQLHFTISLDGYGERAEYIRHGTNWNLLIKNFVGLREGLPQATFHVHFTYSLYNAFHMIDFHKWLMSEGVTPAQFTLNLLVDPRYLRADILPLEYRQKLIAEYEAYNATIPLDGLMIERNTFAGAIRSLKNSPYNDFQMLKKFFSFNDFLDQRRGEKFESVFPEYAGLRKLVDLSPSLAASDTRLSPDVDAF